MDTELLALLSIGVSCFALIYTVFVTHLVEHKIEAKQNFIECSMKLCEKVFSQRVLMESSLFSLKVLNANPRIDRRRLKLIVYLYESILEKSFTVVKEDIKHKIKTNGWLSYGEDSFSNYVKQQNEQDFKLIQSEMYKRWDQELLLFSLEDVLEGNDEFQNLEMSHRIYRGIRSYYFKYLHWETKCRLVLNVWKRIIKRL